MVLASGTNSCGISRAAAFYCSLSTLREAKAGTQSRICESCGARSIFTIQHCQNAHGTLSRIKWIYPRREKIFKNYKIDFRLSKLLQFQRRQVKAWKS